MNISSINNLAANANAHTDVSSRQPASPEQRSLIQAVKAVNPAELFGPDSEFTFKLDPASKRVVVRVVSRQTGELLQQLPPEQVLRLAEEIKGGDSTPGWIT
jgi:flagellar protein FlaG